MYLLNAYSSIIVIFVLIKSSIHLLFVESFNIIRSNSRCQGRFSNDTSVNCRTASDFITDVYSKLENLKAVNSSVYIATNEGNVTVLDQLERSGFVTSRVFSQLSSANIKSSLEILIMDLMLMIYAKDFLHFGFSTYHVLVEVARYQLKSADGLGYHPASIPSRSKELKKVGKRKDN